MSAPSPSPAALSKAELAELVDTLRGDCYDPGVCFSCTACKAADAIEADRERIAALEAALARVRELCEEYEGPQGGAGCGCRTWVSTDEVRAALSAASPSTEQTPKC